MRRRGKKRASASDSARARAGPLSHRLPTTKVTVQAQSSHGSGIVGEEGRGGRGGRGRRERENELEQSGAIAWQQRARGLGGLDGS